MERSKPRVRRPAEWLRGDVREQPRLPLFGVEGGRCVGVPEPPTRAQQLTQHRRHIFVALARLLIENSRSKVGA